MEDRSDAQSARGASTSARPAKKEKFRPGLIHCDVSNPTKSVGFFDQHVQFRVGCRSALRDYITTCRVELVAGEAHFTVTRRFNDFAWVRERLRKMYPGAIVPALPKPKGIEGDGVRAMALDGDAMRRMTARLQTFLDRLCNHPLLYNSPALLNFFTEGNGEAFAASCAAPVEVPAPGTAAAAAAAAVTHRPPTGRSGGVGGSGGGPKLEGLHVVRPPTAHNLKDGGGGAEPAGAPRRSTAGGAEILSIAEDEEFRQPRATASRPPTGMSRGAYGPGPGTPGFEAAVRTALQSGGRLSSSPNLSIEDRFKQIYEVPGRHSRITPSSHAADLANRYNEAVRRLKEKIYSKGSFAITQHFQSLDSDQSGSLERDEFKEALKLFNLGDCVTDEVADMLHRAVDKDNSGAVDYEEFSRALRMGRLSYLPEGGGEGVRRRIGPDPELPFGNPGATAQGPFAYMRDADSNLEAFDQRLNKLYMKLEDSFHLFDKNGSGEVDKNEFLEVMNEMNVQLKLKLSDTEISDLFREADIDSAGTISYQEFVRGFAGAGQRRFIPEFLKPKIARRSAQGNPWDWTAENPNDKFIKKVGSANTYFAEEKASPVRPNRKNWHPEGGKPTSMQKIDAPDPVSYVEDQERRQIK